MKTLRLGFAVLLAACGGGDPAALDRAGVALGPDEVGSTGLAPAPGSLAVDVGHNLTIGRPTMGDLPYLPAPPTQVALEPTLAPRLWVSQAAGRVGDEVRVAIGGVRHGRHVVLAQADGAPAAARFCGSGLADENGIVRGACRLARSPGGTTSIVAYDLVLEGRPLASQRVQVIDTAPEIEIDSYVGIQTRIVTLSGTGKPRNDVSLRLLDPYGETWASPSVEVDGDGHWRYAIALPLDATLGRWTVLTYRRESEEWINAWFDVTPLASARIDPTGVGAKALGLRPFDPITFRFFDPLGIHQADVTGVADRNGVAAPSGEPPNCARTGTWYVRLAYHDARGDATWVDATHRLQSGWCIP